MVGSVQVHNRRESAALDMKAYSHLSAEERIRIDELRNRDGLGVRQIALRIGRDKATVSRELKRGLWFASNENDSYRPYRPKRLKTGPWTCRPFYSAMTAQRKAEQRAREPRKPRQHGVRPAARMGHDQRCARDGRPTHRGTARGRVPPTTRA